MQIAVLGSGVIGVVSIWYLARAEHEVIVVDRQAGFVLETSFANAGEISPGFVRAPSMIARSSLQSNRNASPDAPRRAIFRFGHLCAAAARAIGAIASAKQRNGFGGLVLDLRVMTGRHQPRAAAVALVCHRPI